LGYGPSKLLYSKLHEQPSSQIAKEPVIAADDSKFSLIMDEIKELRQTINQKQFSQESLPLETIKQLRILRFDQLAARTKIEALSQRKTFCKEYQKDISIISPTEIVSILTNKF